MDYILHIETSTKNCSVALSNDTELIAIKELNNASYSHAEMLHTFIEDVLKEASVDISELVAISVSKGPGSYTGLRIGVSAAKGLCYALEIPLIAIATLKSLATSVKIDKGFIIPMIDARRLEVYNAIFDNTNTQIEETKATIINEASFLEYLEKDTVYFLGDGAQKCKELIKHQNAIFIDDKFPSAKDLISLAYDKYQKNDIEDVAYFEPYYLKDFVVIKSKKN